MHVFDNFLKKIQRRASKNQVFNPYKNEQLLNNLKFYFEYMYSLDQKHILLIGEAPGYKGCRLSGIPFTCTTLFESSQHKLFKDLKENITFEVMQSETTAKIVWETLENKKIIPIFWNAFPYHPFQKGNQSSNRAPSAQEIKEGKYYIEELVKIFEPTKIAAIGKKGQKALENIYQNELIEYIRHPSFGGKREFLEQINKVIKLN